jgi:pimeloyl-ACP methyl ester carboxylesterase
MITHVEVEDGRRLEVLVADDRAGLPVLFHSGLPSAVVPYPPLDEAAAAAGVHIVTYSRPGYGDSSPWPTGRDVRVADDVADSVAVLDHLDIGEFATIGWSGGGPRALACAALLPGRCLAATSLAGVAPVGDGGMELEAYLTGMGPENVRDFRATLQGRETLAPILEEEIKDFTDVTGDQIVASFGGLVGEVDAGALTGPFGEWVAAEFRHSVAQGISGILEDSLAVTAPWGFDLGSISVPVDVWQGRLDKMVPFGHGEWLATHVPTARARLFEEEGHLSLFAQIGRILIELRERSGR